MNDLETIFHEQPQSIPCPNCGRKMRLTYFQWKEPRYVCDSFRRDPDCEMVIMMRFERPYADRDISA
jgi:hypothetical protein